MFNMLKEIERLPARWGPVKILDRTLVVEVVVVEDTVVVVAEEEIDAHAVEVEADRQEGVEKVHHVQDLVHEVTVNEEALQEALALFDVLVLRKDLLVQENQVKADQDLGLDRDHQEEGIGKIKPVEHVIFTKVLTMSSTLSCTYFIMTFNNDF